MILITTAGKVGSEAARLLARQEMPVRVLVRDPQKAAALPQAGVAVTEGDLEVPATIDKGMQGVSAVVLVSPAVPAQELNVVRSAVRAGAEHVVKITSKASADSPIARRRGQTEIENGLIGMIDTRDVAAVAAKIAISPAAHAAKTYWPTGPERLSYADAADVLSKVIGRPVTFRPLTFGEERQAMINAGLPESLASMNAQAIALFADGDSDYVTDDVRSILGRPARTFEQFAADYAAAFS